MSIYVYAPLESAAHCSIYMHTLRGLLAYCSLCPLAAGYVVWADLIAGKVSQTASKWVSRSISGRVSQQASR